MTNSIDFRQGNINHNDIPVYQYPTLSIGYERDDGDFRVLATMNNNDNEFTPKQWEKIVAKLMKGLYAYAPEGVTLQVLWREDAPDYVELEE